MAEFFTFIPGVGIARIVVPDPDVVEAMKIMYSAIKDNRFIFTPEDLLAIEVSEDLKKTLDSAIDTFMSDVPVIYSELKSILKRISPEERSRMGLLVDIIEATVRHLENPVGTAVLPLPLHYFIIDYVEAYERLTGITTMYVRGIDAGGGQATLIPGGGCLIVLTSPTVLGESARLIAGATMLMRCAHQLMTFDLLGPMYIFLSEKSNKLKLPDLKGKDLVELTRKANDKKLYFTEASVVLALGNKIIEDVAFRAALMAKYKWKELEPVKPS